MPTLRARCSTAADFGHGGQFQLRNVSVSRDQTSLSTNVTGSSASRRRPARGIRRPEATREKQSPLDHLPTNERLCSGNDPGTLLTSGGRCWSVAGGVDQAPAPEFESGTGEAGHRQPDASHAAGRS
jgi:hypothetical protein